MRNLQTKNRNSEKGGASTKLLLVLAFLFMLAHAGYNYVPVAYEGESMKQEMQTAVVQGMAAPANVMPMDLVKGKLQRAVVANNVPTDAVVEVKNIKNAVTARVAYTKKVNILPFGIYKYNYQFDHTATPTGFLMKAD